MGLAEIQGRASLAAQRASALPVPPLDRSEPERKERERDMLSFGKRRACTESTAVI